MALQPSSIRLTGERQTNYVFSGSGNMAATSKTMPPRSITESRALPTETFAKRPADKFGLKESARVFFARVWVPLIQVRSKANKPLFAEDLRAADYQLYKALNAALSRADLGFADIGLPCSPTRGKLKDIRTEDDQIDHRRKAARERRARFRAKLRNARHAEADSDAVSAPEPAEPAKTVARRQNSHLTT